MGMFDWLCISKNRNQCMNGTYLSMTYDTCRDAGDVGTKKSIKTAIFKAENDSFQPFFLLFRFHIQIWQSISSSALQCKNRHFLARLVCLDMSEEIQVVCLDMWKTTDSVRKKRYFQFFRQFGLEIRFNGYFHRIHILLISIYLEIYRTEIYWTYILWISLLIKMRRHLLKNIYPFVK